MAIVLKCSLAAIQCYSPLSASNSFVDVNTLFKGKIQYRKVMPGYEFHEEEDNQIKGTAKCRRQLFVGTTKGMFHQ